MISHLEEQTLASSRCRWLTGYRARLSAQGKASSIQLGRKAAMAVDARICGGAAAGFGGAHPGEY